ncbi:Fic family protein [Halanaeroarchaeum sulfurireducens]|uniref:Filamentation induced by cAMP protein Fic n=1 Tax=Halanaeroarchaeum sulfurireducens TaxID=1604004 RepID=A0A0F7P8Z6_9EURY|nr:Fic family protein [Halanaeroarchaeum sulfurireducens]AKH97222.1 filamentation induced by cAMP protein Fic [Halanaeroarchaeum sulfurireducens]ALG81624.1 filamentation induced by cAMP protein Fic [Halanaeroarchaeum sulfurireducens]
MAPPSLPESVPGEYRSFGDGEWYIPDPLPPAKEISLPDGFESTLRDAIFQLGRLAAIGAESDTSPLLYTTMVRREAVESILIEGGDINMEKMFKPREVGDGPITDTSVKEALNYESAIRDGAEEVQEGGTIDIGLLQALHQTLMDKARGHANEVGQFRSSSVHIPPPSASEEPFIPPPPREVPSLMQNLVDYITSESGDEPLVEIGVTHYQFETIHPFEDGNGRLGRILITLQLIQHGYLEQPYLYPSAYFNEHKIEYVRKMRAVSERGEWGPWIEFFVNGIREQAKAAYDRTQDLRELRQEYEQRYGSGKTAADRLGIRLFQEPYVDANKVSELLDVSGQTARNAIAQLEADGVLEETTGKQRYKEWKAVDIFDILSNSNP